MRSMRVLLKSAIVSALLVSVASVAQAQTGLSIWAGAGSATTDGTVSLGRDAKQLGVQVALPIVPVAIRGDALLFGNDFKPDNVSYNVNAVVQARLPVVSPYGILGRGRYVVTPDEKVMGWNYGAGLRLGLGRLGVFGEVRKHEVINRTVTVLGITF